MNTLTNNSIDRVAAKQVRFTGKVLRVSLSDGREVSLRIDQVDWLRWLAKATPKQRANWSIEPGGYAIYWEDLDDGIEACHLFDLQPIFQKPALTAGKTEPRRKRAKTLV
ncbi:MAG: DUF2442 domain-containing protein [Verrucomicrobiota bacterium]